MRRKDVFVIAIALICLMTSCCAYSVEDGSDSGDGRYRLADLKVGNEKVPEGQWLKRVFRSI